MGLAASAFAATSIVFLICKGSFYWLGGRVAEPLAWVDRELYDVVLALRARRSRAGAAASVRWQTQARRGGILGAAALTGRRYISLDESARGCSGSRRSVSCLTTA